MNDAVQTGPVARKDRIEVIDILRGVAILGILHLNMPYNVGDENLSWLFPEQFGSSTADWWVFGVMEVFTSGTFRGMLEILFAAGLMMMTARAMQPDGPVAVADVWYRRNLWLMAFGLFNWIALSYFGDVLFTYAAAAVLLFPFRKLSVRWLLCIFAGFLLWTGVDRYQTYQDTLEERATVEIAKQAIANGETLGEAEAELLEKHEAKARGEMSEEYQERFEKSAELHAGGVTFLQTGYYHFKWMWDDGDLFDWAKYSFFAMIFGLALYKFGFTQGSLSSRTYVFIILVGYGVGWALRVFDLQFDLADEPSPVRIISEIPRLMVAMAHISVLHLLYRSRAGGLLTKTLGQVGRVAFSTYLIQSFIMVYIIAAPWGFNLYGNIGWANSLLYSAIIMVLQVPLAMWWLGRYRFGPLEWAWRSLTHWQVQPMRLRAENEAQPPYGPQPKTS